MTVGEFQDRWNAAIGNDFLEIREVDQRETTFESRPSPVIRVSGRTDTSGQILSVQVTYSGARDGGTVDGSIERLHAAFASETLPSVVAPELPTSEANAVLTDMGWPSPDDGLEGVHLEGKAGGVHFAVRDEGQSGIVMTAEPTE